MFQWTKTHGPYRKKGVGRRVRSAYPASASRQPPEPGIPAVEGGVTGWSTDEVSSDRPGLIHGDGALQSSTRFGVAAVPTAEAVAGGWCRRQGDGERRVGEVVGRGAHRATVDTGGGAGHQAAADFADGQHRPGEAGGDDPARGAQGHSARPRPDTGAAPAGEAGAGCRRGSEGDGCTGGKVGHTGGAGSAAVQAGGGAGHRAQPDADLVEGERGLTRRGGVEAGGGGLGGIQGDRAVGGRAGTGAAPAGEGGAGMGGGGEGNGGVAVVGCGAGRAAIDAGGGAGYPARAAAGFADREHRPGKGGGDGPSGGHRHSARPRPDTGAAPAGEAGAGCRRGSEGDEGAAGVGLGAHWAAVDTRWGAGDRAHPIAGLGHGQGRRRTYNYLV